MNGITAGDFFEDPIKRKEIVAGILSNYQRQQAALKNRATETNQDAEPNVYIRARVLTVKNGKPRSKIMWAIRQQQGGMISLVKVNRSGLRKKGQKQIICKQGDIVWERPAYMGKDGLLHYTAES